LKTSGRLSNTSPATRQKMTGPLVSSH
jgi:hypothetical protein